MILEPRLETPLKPSCVILFRRDTDFVYRGTLLDQIYEKCSAPASRAALVGLGGVGKSQLAIEHCYRAEGASPDAWVLQRQVDSADITAVVAHVGKRRLILVSVYIPDVSSSRRTKEENGEALVSRLEAIQALVQDELVRDPRTEVVVAGDFNRHNPLWGGSHIDSTARQEESEPIIDFMAELSLQSLLPDPAVAFR